MKATEENDAEDVAKMVKKLSENLRNSLPNITARPPAQDTADKKNPVTSFSFSRACGELTAAMEAIT